MEKNGNTDIDFAFTEGPGPHPLTGTMGILVSTTLDRGQILTIWGPTREEALSGLKNQVDACRIAGGGVGGGPRC